MCSELRLVCFGLARFDGEHALVLLSSQVAHFVLQQSAVFRGIRPGG